MDKIIHFKRLVVMLFVCLVNGIPFKYNYTGIYDFIKQLNAVESIFTEEQLL